MTSTSYPYFEGERVIGNRGPVLDGRGDLAQNSVGHYYVSSRHYITVTDDAGNYLFDFGSPMLADGGFSDPSSHLAVAIDSQDFVWVTDDRTHKVQKFAADGELLLTLGGTAGSADGQFNAPVEVATDSDDNVYVVDKNNHRIQKFDSAGNFLWKVGGPTSGNTTTTFNLPNDIAINADDEIYVVDASNSAIKKYDTSGTHLFTITGNTDGFLYCPTDPWLGAIRGIDFTSTGDLRVNVQAGICPSVYTYTNDVYTGKIDHDVDNRNTYEMIVADDDSLVFYTRDWQIFAQLTTGSVYVNNPDGSKNFNFGDGMRDGDLRRPSGNLAEDSQGNLFVVDNGSYRIQKFDPTGAHLATFGTYGATADGNFPNQPRNITIDDDDNVYIGVGLTLVKFDNDGTFIEDIVLTGATGPSAGQGIGDVHIGSDTNIYMTEPHGLGDRIHVYDANGTFVRDIGTDLASAAYSKFTIHNDRIYTVGQTGWTGTGGSLRVYELDGTLISQFSRDRQVDGENYSYFRISPHHDIDLDSFGNIYVLGLFPQVNNIDDHLGVLTHDGRVIYTHSERFSNYNLGGSSLSRNFNFIISPNTNEYITNGDFNYIRARTVSRIVTPPTEVQNVTTTALGNGKLQVEWDAPASDGGAALTNYYIELQPDNYTGWIDAATVDGSTTSAIINVLAGTPDIVVKAANPAGLSPAAMLTGVEATAAYTYLESRVAEDYGYLRGFAFDADDNRYAIDQNNERINVYDSSGTLLRTFGDTELNYPQSINLSPDNQLYVTDCGNDEIYIYNLDGTLTNTLGTYGQADGQLYCPERIVFDDDGTMIILNQWSNVQRWQTDGTFVERLAPELNSPTALARDSDGNLYIMNSDDPTGYGVHKYDPDGNLLLSFGAEGEGEGEFYEFYGMVINPGNLLIINDVWNYRLMIYDLDGNLLETQGYGYSYEPGYMTFTNAEGLDIDNYGNLFIGDSYAAENTYQVLGWTSSVPTTPPDPDNPDATDPDSPSSPTSASDNAGDGSGLGETGAALMLYALAGLLLIATSGIVIYRHVSFGKTIRR